MLRRHTDKPSAILPRLSKPGFTWQAYFYEQDRHKVKAGDQVDIYVDDGAYAQVTLVRQQPDGTWTTNNSLPTGGHR